MTDKTFAQETILERIRKKEGWATRFNDYQDYYDTQGEHQEYNDYNAYYDYSAHNDYCAYGYDAYSDCCNDI